MRLTISSLYFLCVLGLSAVSATASDDRIGVIAGNPSASPDGKSVVFSADFDGPHTTPRLWVSNLDGTDQRRLPTAPSSRGDDEPVWSPDGGTIAFTSYNGTTTDIWSISPQGQRLTQLTTNTLNNRQPIWSPDGKKIVFISDRGGSNDLWIMNADSTGVTRLTISPSQEDHPSFSPDGTTIVFSQTIGDKANLMLIDTDGTNLRPLTSPGWRDWNPSWGVTSIVFASDRDTTSEHWKIWSIQPNGTGLGKIADIIALDPAWTRNGNIIFSDILAKSSAITAITVLDPITGRKRLVTKVDGYLAVVDIRPYSNINYIWPQSKGQVGVAVISSPRFKPVTAVDRTTLRFGRTGTENSLSWCNDHEMKDLNNDGIPDLVCRYSIRASGFTNSDTLGILRFTDKAGTAYEGKDALVICDFDVPGDLDGQ
jgi:Tol biopolymer transport system component